MQATAARLVWRDYFLPELESFLLFYYAAACIQRFANVISVKLKYATVKNDAYADLIAEKLSLQPVRSIDNPFYTVLYDSGRQILALFDYDSPAKLLLACEDAAVLSRAAEGYPFTYTPLYCKSHIYFC